MSDRDLECVWVHAGLIASKICDMEFDCEHCPLDAALRQSFRGPHEDAGSSRSASAPELSALESETSRFVVQKKILESFFHQLEQYSIREDRYYFRAHTWVQDGQQRIARIGVDDLAARLLPHANSIVFPSVRTRVQQGEYCTWLVGAAGTIAFVSPVTGTIAEVNEDLYALPDLVRTSPYEKGWLLRIELEKFGVDMRRLLPRISASARFRKDIEHLRRRILVHSNVDSLPAGVTLLDGGRYVENVESLLGPRKYIELISILFHP